MKNPHFKKKQSNKQALNTVLFSFYFLLSAGCAVTPTPPPEPQWTKTSFENLSGWHLDNLEEALPALKSVCHTSLKQEDTAPFASGTSKYLAGTVASWRQACSQIEIFSQDPSGPTKESVQEFFNAQFQAWELSPKPNEKGLFTGYFEPELLGSLRQEGMFQTPLWQKPHDYVRVNLGDFLPDLKGRSIVGKVEKGALKPYDDRATIAAGSLEQKTEYGTPRATPLVYVNDKIGAFFLEIQGSGRILLQNGDTIRIGYDAQNGHGYTPIGRVLLDRGLINKPVTMPKIRAWLEAHPDQAQQIMNSNPSVVFFKQRQESEPVGALGLPLVPERSLAIDPSYIPLGTPVWLTTTAPASPRLVVTMDTGGAIKGLVRGDLFWGRGPKAEEAAGIMQSDGSYYLILPHGVTPIKKGSESRP